MIKVIGSSVTHDEVELIVTAAHFFLDRLLPAAQQKSLRQIWMLLIGLAVRQSRLSGWLGHEGFLVEAAAPFCDDSIGCCWGQRWVKVAANEIVHVAQTVSGRLKISLKNRIVNGKREDAYAVSWVNGKFAFVDMTPRDDRLWEIEAHQLKTQLVDEFGVVSWQSQKIADTKTEKPWLWFVCHPPPNH